MHAIGLDDSRGDFPGNSSAIGATFRKSYSNCSGGGTTHHQDQEGYEEQVDTDARQDSLAQARLELDGQRSAQEHLSDRAYGAALIRIVLLTRLTILPRGHPNVSFKGFSKRGHRIIACGGRDDAQLVITRAQPRGGYI